MATSPSAATSIPDAKSKAEPNGIHSKFNSPTPAQKFAEAFAVVRSNRTKLNELHQKIGSSQEGDISRSALEEEQKQLLEKQCLWLDKACIILWEHASSPFPEWAELGKALLRELLDEKRSDPEHIYETANHLIRHLLDNARALMWGTPTEEEAITLFYRAREIKRYLADALQNAALVRNRGFSVAINPRLIAEHTEIIAHVYKLLNEINQAIKYMDDTDRDKFMRVLGMDKDLKRVRETLQFDEKRINTSIHFRIKTLIAEEYAKYKADADSLSLPPLPPFPPGWSFDILNPNTLAERKTSRDLALAQHAKELSSIVDPKTGDTVLHVLARKAKTKADQTLLEELIKANPSAVLIRNKAGALPEDGATLLDVKKLFTSFNLPEEFESLRCHYDPNVGYGFIVFNTPFGIDNMRMVYKACGMLIEQEVPKREQDPLVAPNYDKPTDRKVMWEKGTITLGNKAMPIDLKTAQVEFQYSPTNPPYGNRAIERMVLIDNGYEKSNAILLFKVNSELRNESVKRAILCVFERYKIKPADKFSSLITLLNAATEAQDLQTATYLLKDLGEKEKVSIINHISSQGRSLLSDSVDGPNKDSDLALLYLKNGGNPYLVHENRGDQTQTSPFRLAVHYGYYKIVDAMLGTFKEKEQEKKNKDEENNHWSKEELKLQLGRSLFRAVITGNNNLLCVLLKHGADPNFALAANIFGHSLRPRLSIEDLKVAKDSSKNTPLHTPYHWALAMKSGIGYTQPQDFADMIYIFHEHSLPNLKPNPNLKTGIRLTHSLLPDDRGIQVGANALAILIQARSYSKIRTYEIKIMHLLNAGVDPAQICFTNAQSRAFNAVQLAENLGMQDIIPLLSKDPKAQSEIKTLLESGTFLLEKKLEQDKAPIFKAHLRRLREVEFEQCQVILETAPKGSVGAEAFGLTAERTIDFRADVVSYCQRFYTEPELLGPESLKLFLGVLYRLCEKLRAQGRDHPYSELLKELEVESVMSVAINLLNCVATSTQLLGWLKAAEFIDQETFKERERIKLPGTKPVIPDRMNAGAGQGVMVQYYEEISFKIAGSNYQEQISNLMNHPGIQRAFNLLSYFMNLVLKNPQPGLSLQDHALCVLLLMTPKYATEMEGRMKSLSNDATFMGITGRFCGIAEELCTSMHNDKTKARKWEIYRELQKKGVPWPHDPVFRTTIEGFYFNFRPEMLKRDRSLCDPITDSHHPKITHAKEFKPCGVQVTGWHAWQFVWDQHDLSKHDAKSRDEIERQTPKFCRYLHVPFTEDALTVFRSAGNSSNDRTRELLAQNPLFSVLNFSKPQKKATIAEVVSDAATDVKAGMDHPPNLTSALIAPSMGGIVTPQFKLAGSAGSNTLVPPANGVIPDSTQRKKDKMQNLSTG